MYNNQENENLSLRDFILMLWHWKWLIILLTISFAVGSYFYALSLPKMYRSSCRVLPANNSSNNNLYNLGALSDFLPRGASNGQLMLSILRGDIIIDAIIKRFNLQGSSWTAARSYVLGKLQTFEEARSGILTISVVDTNPDMAAEMANAFVEELQRRVRELSLIETANQRTFFEEYLNESRIRLEEAEKALQEYQQRKGLIMPETEIRDMMSSILKLRSQISAKNIEIATLETYTQRNNPKLRNARSQLEAMTKELAALEETSQKSGINTKDETFKIDQTFEFEREYQHLRRNVQIASATYEALLKRFENARLSELGDFSPLQLIDPATPPDLAYGPSKRNFVMKWTAIGAFLGITWAFAVDYILKLIRGPEV